MLTQGPRATGNIGFSLKTQRLSYFVDTAKKSYYLIQQGRMLDVHDCLALREINRKNKIKSYDMFFLFSSRSSGVWIQGLCIRIYVFFSFFFYVSMAQGGRIIYSLVGLCSSILLMDVIPIYKLTMLQRWYLRSELVYRQRFRTHQQLQFAAIFLNFKKKKRNETTKVFQILPPLIISLNTNTQ